MAANTSTEAGTGRRALLMAGGALLMGVHLPAAAKTVFAEVWKDPNCGCCKDWVAHLEKNGFTVKVNDVGNDAIRTRLGVEAKYGGCHTALIGGYAIEGHVPAREIVRLLRERPDAIGLAVPGMPVGSPGMDGAGYGSRRDLYTVLLLAKGGATTIYQRYEARKS